MSQRPLKPLRVVLALLFLGAAAALFLDLEARVPAVGYQAVLWPQFLPSMVKFANAATWAAAWAAGGFAVVLLLTLVFGRVYCSTICPLGTLQDLVIRLSGAMRRRGTRVRFRFRPASNLVRYGLLAVAVSIAIWGPVALVFHLDPFSQFGRIMGLLVRPLAVGLNNLAVRILQEADSYLLAPASFVLAHWQALLAPLLILGILVWMSASRGRLFCNSLCPVGTLLGLVSRFSLFRVVIDRSECNLCARCSVQCKAECIHLKSQRVEFDRCVACFNCIPACPESGIGYRLAWKASVRAKTGSGTEASEIPASGGVQRALGGGQIGARSRARVSTDRGEMSPDRRGFLLGGSAFLIGAAGVAEPSRSRDWPQNKRPTEIPVVKEHPVSPPGAVATTRFNAACTACQLCVSVCPTQVLQPSLLSYGALGFLQPHMAFDVAYCTYECVRCGEVCPTGAIRLLMLEAKKTSKIGEVRFIEDNCIVATEKTACGACAEHCPTRAVHMVPYEGELTLPELNTATCIGCGACEHACPVQPHRAIYVDGEPVHRVAEPPPSEPLDVEVPGEFPF